MSEKGAEGPQNPSRRNFLKLSLGAGALVAEEAVSQAVNKTSFLQAALGLIFKTRERRSENGEFLPTPVAEKTLIVDDLNRINCLSLDSNQRPVAENDYVNRAKTLEEIDNGFKVVTDRQLRIKLFEKRYELRQKGHPQLRKLIQPELDLANEYKIHPETLAICTDLRERARSRIDQQLKNDRFGFLGKFKADLILLMNEGRMPRGVLERITADDMLINPLAMAMILVRETGFTKTGTLEPIFGGVNIGTGPAIKLLRNLDDPKEAADAKQGLNDLYGDLNTLNKSHVAPVQNLSYVVENIPGAPQDPRDKISGGDVGIVQFRPNTAWVVHQRLKSIFNMSLNPLSLDAIEAAYLFIASGAVVDVKEKDKNIKVPQYGYINSDSENLNQVLHEQGLFGKIERASLDKWNSNLAPYILAWKKIYHDRIIKPGIFQSQIVPYYQQQNSEKLAKAG